jgi:hypothetical protein
VANNSGQSVCGAEGSQVSVADKQLVMPQGTYDVSVFARCMSEGNVSGEASPLCSIINRIYIYIFHLVVCLTTGPKPLPKRALHIVQSRASSFK